MDPFCAPVYLNLTEMDGTAQVKAFCHTGYIGDGQTCLGDSNKFPSMSRKVLYDQRGAIFIAALSIHTIPAIRSGK